MKTIITSIVLLIYSCSFSQKTKEIRIDRKYIENCETGKGPCDPIKQEINANETLIVNLPGGGTQTEIQIMGPGSISSTLNGGIDDIFQYRITKPGNYSFSYFSCGLGGSFILEVVQKDN